MIKAIGVTDKGKWSTMGMATGKDKDPVDLAYENLANAIIFKAVRDYQHALITLHSNPNDWRAKARCSEVIVFFKSSFYRVLTSIDYEYLVRNAVKQVEERGWKRFYLGYGD